MDRATCERHKEIAEGARKLLAKLNIKSTNKFWQANAKTKRGLDTQRAMFGYGTDGHERDIGVASGTWRQMESDEFVADVTAGLSAGNCDEKASVYGTFASRSPKIGASHIYRCSFKPYDHVIAIMSLNTIALGTGRLTFADFGDDAVVLDGWAEDWWFPNVGKKDTMHYNLWRIGTPFALVVRNNSKKCNRLKTVSQMC